MSARRILQLGNPLLRAVSTPSSDSGECERILTDLRDTLHEFQRTRGFGRGISAVQIGEPKRLLYLEFRGRPYTLVNPEWDWRSEETFRLWDDCFSFPDLLVYVERSCAVRVRYQDLCGASHVLEAENDLSELLQHEMDHLDGILTIDRAIDRNSFCTREEWLRQGHPATRPEAFASKT
ncbi:MAG: peptide deformylase [Bryobacterales bacterium]|nr:peptide deformylase [Bryobacterales bacterium]